MSQFNKLPKIRDAEKESQYGYVHAVSGPGELPQRLCLCPRGCEVQPVVSEVMGHSGHQAIKRFVSRGIR